jgi:hypothetical protein
VTDLLTHVLVAYVAVALLAAAGRVDDRYVPVAMGGAVIPDLAKAQWVVGGGTVEGVLGTPFSWLPFHRLGGAVAVAGIVALLFARERARVFAVLAAGAGSHFVLDALIERANGLSPPYLYPVTWSRPPSGGLYLSSDYWPVVVAVVAAVAVWVGRRYAEGGVGD